MSAWAHACLSRSTHRLASSAVVALPTRARAESHGARWARGEPCPDADAAGPSATGSPPGELGGERAYEQSSFACEPPSLFASTSNSYLAMHYAPRRRGRVPAQTWSNGANQARGWDCGAYEFSSPFLTSVTVELAPSVYLHASASPICSPRGEKSIGPYVCLALLSGSRLYRSSFPCSSSHRRCHGPRRPRPGEPCYNTRLSARWREGF